MCQAGSKRNGWERGDIQYSSHNLDQDESEREYSVDRREGKDRDGLMK